MNMTNDTAPAATAAPRILIVEDEPALALHLAQQLKAHWPQAALLPHAHNGAQGINAALAELPQVIFLDIQMPTCSGLDAAEAIIEDWPSGQRLPCFVFVTAFAQYAVQAFDHAAIDYLLKPVSAERLRKTIARLQDHLAPGATPPLAEHLGEELRGLAGAATPHEVAAPAPERLSVVNAAVGNVTHVIPVGEVVYFEAADKYLCVHTVQREALIRLSLRDLLARLDPAQFWQIHRSLVVQVAQISHVERTDEGRLLLSLRGHPRKLPISRLYAHRFKAM